MTKGQAIKFLKSKGIRKGDKYGVGTVPLEQLKFSQIMSIIASLPEEVNTVMSNEVS